MPAPTQRQDPLPVFCFKVTIFTSVNKVVDVPMDAFFKSVSGIRYETESIPVREGGTNDTTYMLVGATKWSPLVFKKGYAKGSALLAWREAWLNGNMFRASGTITQYDTAFRTMAQWDFERGWPSKWEISEFDASKSELAIETLEITHERLTSK